LIDYCEFPAELRQLSRRQEFGELLRLFWNRGLAAAAPDRRD
jgi:hypothetical protein